MNVFLVKVFFKLPKNSIILDHSLIKLLFHIDIHRLFQVFLEYLYLLLHLFNACLLNLNLVLNLCFQSFPLREALEAFSLRISSKRLTISLICSFCLPKSETISEKSLNYGCTSCLKLFSWAEVQYLSSSVLKLSRSTSVAQLEIRILVSLNLVSCSLLYCMKPSLLWFIRVIRSAWNHLIDSSAALILVSISLVIVSRLA